MANHYMRTLVPGESSHFLFLGPTETWLACV
jgi:hypothetical protein